MVKRLPPVKAGGGVSVLACAIAAALYGGTAALAQDRVGLEEVVVTGSRIVRRDFEANSPITTIDATRFEETSTIAIESVVNQLPQFVPAASQFESGGQGTGGYLGGSTRTPGAATLSLRGLGPNRNLVLLDGRRAMPVNANMAVNINTIPAAAVERVETITGGASSVYGADAIAGVVNFILKRDFEGVDFNMQWGQTAEGDGEEYRFSGIFGANFADGRGNVLLGFDRSSRGEILLRDREFYRRGFTDPTVQGTGRTTASGMIIPGNNPISQAALDQVFGERPAGTVGRTGTFYMNSDGTVYKNTSDASYRYNGPTLDVDGETIWRKIRDDGSLQENRTHLQAQIPLDRYSVFARAHLDIADNLTLFGQAMFSDSSSRAIGPATPFTGGWRVAVPHGSDIYAPSVDENGNTLPAYLPGGRFGLNCAPVGGCTNSQVWPTPPEVEFLLDNRANPNAPFEIGQETLWAGGRTNYTDVSSYQVTMGIEGTLPANDWTWEMFASHGETRTLHTFEGLASLERWRFVANQPNYGRGMQYTGNPLGEGFAAGTVTCTSGLPLVYGLGFVEGDRPSDDCLHAISAISKDAGHMKQTVMEFNLQGGAWELPAGELGFAVGASYRTNSYSFLPDTLSTHASVIDIIAGVFPADMSRGDTEATEIYGELLVPLLEGKPGARALNLELGYRQSDNDPSEDVDSYKALIDWRIHDRVRFRGGRQTANRAPNIAELYQSAEQLYVSSARGDWCSDLNPGNPLSPNPALNPNAAQARAICEAIMGPAAAEVFYSNPNRSNSFTQFRWVNLVGNPDLKTETAETTTAGIVADIGESTRLTVDYWRIEITDMVSAQNIDAIHATCFDPVTNPTFDPNHPACQQIGRDPFDGAQAPHTAYYTNQGAIDTSGVDIQVDWSGSIGQGQLSLNFLATLLNEMKTRPTPESDWTDWKGSSGPSDLTGVQGFAYDYRTLSTLSYSRGPWTASLRWRHLPSIQSEGKIVNPAGTQVPTSSYDIFDLAGRWSVNGRWELRYGIDNVFDTDPEITFADHTTSGAGSTNANFYDILGRRYYLGLQMAF